MANKTKLQETTIIKESAIYPIDAVSKMHVEHDILKKNSEHYPK